MGNCRHAHIIRSYCSNGSLIALAFMLRNSAYGILSWMFILSTCFSSPSSVKKDASFIVACLENWFFQEPRYRTAMWLSHWGHTLSLKLRRLHGRMYADQLQTAVKVMWLRLMVKSVASDRFPITLCDDNWSVSSKIDTSRTSRLNILKLKNSEKILV